MSKKASSITSRNSDSNALNGLKKRQSHLICNWLLLSSFHHQFLERCESQETPVATAPFSVQGRTLQELAAQHAKRERVVWRATLPIRALNTKRQFLAQVTEPQVVVNAS